MSPTPSRCGVNLEPSLEKEHTGGTREDGGLSAQGFNPAFRPGLSRSFPPAFNWEAAFYTLAGASFGLQIGLQDTEIVLVLRSEKALNAILEHQAKLGADAGITVGVVGMGVEASTTTALGPDVLAFANSILGLYGGASLEGAVLVRRTDLNEAFYAPGAVARAIVFENKYTNPKAEPLRTALAAP